jgi:hypothetical protein
VFIHGGARRDGGVDEVVLRRGGRGRRAAWSVLVRMHMLGWMACDSSVHLLFDHQAPYEAVSVTFLQHVQQRRRSPAVAESGLAEQADTFPLRDLRKSWGHAAIIHRKMCGGARSLHH